MKRGALLAAAACVLASASVAGQSVPPLRLRLGSREDSVALTRARGFTALPISGLGGVGWGVERTGVGAVLTGPAGLRVELRDGTPFVRWGNGVLQLAHVPYFEGPDLYVPLQLVSDLLPGALPEAYAFEPGTSALAWLAAPPPVVVPPRLAAAAPPPAPAAQPLRVADSIHARLSLPAGERRVVVIDAGHGGEDPGTISRGGIREKNVALGIARAMAEELGGSQELEVVLIRDGDTFVPLWDRGARATTVKGERPGIFVSIHANSASTRGSPARGFETYFLSEARTEHERRVAAIENAPLGVDPASGGASGDLDFILRELKNLDHQHWSSLLADMVQQEVARVHPGPDRGVKQAPLAVITNAIMPAVLVEIGYLSHADEARVLGTPEFQRQAGHALARAVARFFQRYPPGSGSGSGEER